ncbi:MAG: hypothetical protein QXO71_03950 [Candidatus Jordarchaeaceae archaeon]
MRFRGRRRNLAWCRITPVLTNSITTNRRDQTLETVSASPITSIPADYKYIGRCRCGYGPNAYYQAPNGSIIPANRMFTGRIQQASYPAISVNSQDREKMLKERLERLQEEISEVTNQLEELEEQEGKKKRNPFKWRLK